MFVMRIFGIVYKTQCMTVHCKNDVHVGYRYVNVGYYGVNPQFYKDKRQNKIYTLEYLQYLVNTTYNAMM